MIKNTWRCEICKRERNDEDISVVSLRYNLPNGGSVGRNVKHCIDEVSCLEAATTVAIKNYFDSVKNYDSK